MLPPPTFWTLLDQLVRKNPLVIDRPEGHVIPRYPHLRYPLDYGYLEHTTAADGAGIDLWRGSLTETMPTGIICTIDMVKQDAEIKILCGCTEEEMQTILAFHNNHPTTMQGILIRRE
ncbi:MAG: hypothetical protein PHQ27_02930 [Victivallales bacterium]|nr:hypothetical protein [Victivallales bacterium]